MSVIFVEWGEDIQRRRNVSNGRKKLIIDFTNNLICHRRSKHIEIKFHYLRDQVRNGEIILTYCMTNYQVKI